MVQIIWFAVQVTKAVKNVKSSKFTFCNSLQTEIVRQVEFHTFAWSFLVYNTESESKISVQRNSAELWLIKTRKFFYMTSKKQTVQSECFMNERQPNSPGNMKIVQDDSAIKLGCSDWCGLPLNASGRMSEQALIFSLEGRQMKFLWLASLRWPKMAMISEPRWTSPWSQSLWHRHD